jgi:type I restriction enzyme, S subunit
LTSSAMKQIPLIVAPAKEQTRIVKKLEELLSDLEAGVAELKAAQKKLVQYRQSLMKAAVEGALTAKWRKTHHPEETGAQLLERILKERRSRWDAKQLAKYQEQGKTPPKDWQDKYPEPVKPDTSNLPELPGGWIWASLDQLASMVRNGLSQKPHQEPTGYPILRINAVRPMSVNFNEVRYLALTESAVSDYILEDGDLLATRYNGSVDLLGVFGVVRGLTVQTIYPDKLIRIKPVLRYQLADWIEICAAIGESRRYIVSRVKTTAGQTGISGEDVKKMPIPLAPLEEQAVVSDDLKRLIPEIARQSGFIETSFKQSAAQRKNILKAAFSGQLVPQDPNDEPASMLLERIRNERKTQISKGSTRTRKLNNA